jgi:hypothetical protein
MKLATIAIFNSILLVSAMKPTKPADHSAGTIKKFGWTAVPHAQSELLKDVSPWDPANYTVADIKVPDSEVAKKAVQYAKKHLPEQTFNHSMRVYYYGQHYSPNSNSPPISQGKTFPDTADRRRNRPKAPPIVPSKPRNVLLNLPLPRHRHHAGESPRHSAIFRVLRRVPCPQRIASLRCAQGASRKRDRGDYPASGSR